MGSKIIGICGKVSNVIERVFTIIHHANSINQTNWFHHFEGGLFNMS